MLNSHVGNVGGFGFVFFFMGFILVYLHLSFLFNRLNSHVDVGGFGFGFFFLGHLEQLTSLVSLHLLFLFNSFNSHVRGFGFFIFPHSIVL